MDVKNLSLSLSLTLKNLHSMFKKPSWFSCKGLPISPWLFIGWSVRLLLRNAAALSSSCTYDFPFGKASNMQACEDARTIYPLALSCRRWGGKVDEDVCAAQEKLANSKKESDSTGISSSMRFCSRFCLIIVNHAPLNLCLCYIKSLWIFS